MQRSTALGALVIHEQLGSAIYRGRHCWTMNDEMGYFEDLHRPQLPLCVDHMSLASIALPIISPYKLYTF